MLSNILTFTEFYLSGSVQGVSHERKGFGHCITSDLSGDREVYRQERKLYGEANKLIVLYALLTLHACGAKKTNLRQYATASEGPKKL